MSSKYLGEKLARQATIDTLRLIKGIQRYTSKEIVNILESDYAPKQIRTILYRLKDQGNIAGTAYEGYSITSKGISRLKKLQLAHLESTQPWDMKWRLVIYDVPEEHRSSRDQIRFLIKKLGFKQLQQSVWAHPLPCLNEFEQIQEAYGVQRHLLLLEVDHCDDYNHLFDEFKQTYSNLTSTSVS